MTGTTALTPRRTHPTKHLAIFTLLGSVAVANVAYTILIPFVPTLSRDFGMSATMIGVAFGGFAASKALVQPVGGWVSDRFGARETAAGGLLVAALATAALALADNGTQVITLRLLWGLGEGMSIPALYQMAGALGKRTGVGEAQVLGWFGSAAVVGMTAGPGLVALLSGVLTFRTAFLLGAALTLCSAVLVLFGLRGLTGGEPDPRTEPGEAPESPNQATSTHDRRRQALLIATVLCLGALDLANNFIYAALEPVLPLYAGETLDIGQRTISAVFFLGLALFALFAALAGRIVPRIGLLRATAGSFAGQALALLLATRSSSFTLLAIAFLAVMCLQPLVYVAVRTAVAQLGSERPGSAFGWFGMISDIGWVIGPITAAGLLSGLGAGVFAVLAGLAVAGALGTLAIAALTNILRG